MDPGARMDSPVTEEDKEDGVEFPVCQHRKCGTLEFDNKGEEENNNDEDKGEASEEDGVGFSVRQYRKGEAVVESYDCCTSATCSHITGFVPQEYLHTDATVGAAKTAMTDMETMTVATVATMGINCSSICTSSSK